MPAPIFPTAVAVMGNVKVQFVTAIASLTAPSLATEINAASSLDVSCYLTADGWSGTSESSKVTPPRRLCSKRVFERNGVVNDSLTNIHYIIDPQAAAATNGKKAFEKLTNGATGYFVVRFGLDAQTVDWTAGQFVNIWPVVLGVPTITGDAGDEAAEVYVDQGVAVAAPGLSQNIVIAA